MITKEEIKTEQDRVPYIEVNNLVTRFFTSKGIVKALEHVSFKIHPGEVYGLVGESGCGKSVTSTSIMDLIPDPPGRILEGEIFIDNFNILSDLKSLAKIRIRSETDVNSIIVSYFLYPVNINFPLVFFNHTCYLFSNIFLICDVIQKRCYGSLQIRDSKISGPLINDLFSCRIIIYLRELVKQLVNIGCFHRFPFDNGICHSNYVMEHNCLRNLISNCDGRIQCKKRLLENH